VEVNEFILLQHPFALPNDLICVGSLECATPYVARRYVTASLCCFLSVHCSKRSGCVLFEVYILYAVLLVVSVAGGCYRECHVC
jgi:hypothetical protein